MAVALAMELISRNLRRAPSPSATLERSEYARRDRDIFWYLLRGSIWETYTRYDHRFIFGPRQNFDKLNLPRPKIDSVIDRTANAPLLGLLSAVAKDWIPLIDEYYYCKSIRNNP